jgi:hypothetical protein
MAMDGILYSLFSAVAILGVWIGIIEFRLSRSTDAVIFPGTSLLLTILLMISSKFVETELFSPAESNFIFAFWLCMFILSFGLMFVMAAGTFRSEGVK